MSSEPIVQVSPADRVRWKSAMVDWLHSFEFTHAITLSWNRQVGMARARADLSHLMRRVDRKLLGSYFHKMPSDERTLALFAVEKGASQDHFHVHSLWRAPARKWFQLGKLFGVQRGGIWNDIVATGSCTVDAIEGGRNDDFVGYILKEQHCGSDDQLLVWADEFHRVR